MDEIRVHFLAQAKACDDLGSPFTARLCRILARHLDASTRTGRTVLGWPGDVHADAVSLRLCGGLHQLVLTGADAGLAAVYPPHDVGDDEIATAVTSAMRRFEDRRAAATPAAPIFWLRMEPLSTDDPFATLSLRQWPGKRGLGTKGSGGAMRRLARCDYHGRWIEWIDQP
jgi:hypothetical protein